MSLEEWVLDLWVDKKIGRQSRDKRHSLIEKLVPSVWRDQRKQSNNFDAHRSELKDEAESRHHVTSIKAQVFLFHTD